MLPGMAAPLQVVTAEEAPPLQLGALPARPDGPIKTVTAALEALAPTSHRLHIALPAMCADCASLAVLLGDLVHAYGLPPLAPPGDPAPQYVDLSQWQHELLEAEETAPGREFWRERGAIQTSLPLPWEPAPDAVASFAAQPVPLTARAAARVNVTATCLGVAPATVLLAAWKTLPARSVGEPEITVGVLVDGRAYEDLRGACGLLARYLPIRSALLATLLFARFAAQVEQDLEVAGGWQECFVASDMALDWTFGFEYALAPAPAPAADAIFTLIADRVCIAPVMLQLTCIERGAAFDCAIEYDAQTIAGAAAARIAEQFAALLDALLEQPDLSIGAAPALSAAQRETLLRLSSAPALPPADAASTLHGQIARHADTTPTAIAADVRRSASAGKPARAAVARPRRAGRTTGCCLPAAYGGAGGEHDCGDASGRGLRPARSDPTAGTPCAPDRRHCARRYSDRPDATVTASCN
jgi:hypothetical protein